MEKLALCTYFNYFSKYLNILKIVVLTKLLQFEGTVVLQISSWNPTP